MKRHLRITRLAACFLTGALVLQVGPCLSMGIPFGLTAANPANFLDQNETFLGIFAPCGVPDWIFVDANGSTVGTVQAAEDDLIFGCPVSTVLQPTDTGGGGGG